MVLITYALRLLNRSGNYTLIAVGILRFVMQCRLRVGSLFFMSTVGCHLLSAVSSYCRSFSPTAQTRGGLVAGIDRG